MISTITVANKMVQRRVFICSDGKEFDSPTIAGKHESLLRIEEIFAGTSLKSKHAKKGKKFFFSHDMALDCGTYRIAVRDEDDVEALDFFFNGIFEQIGSPEKDDYPIEFDLEIFYEEMKDVVITHAMWKIYNIKEHQI